jgi:hypothetical protein
MTAAKKKLADEEPETLPEPSLLKAPIPHAYALIPVEGRPGRFYAVHLRNVTAMGLDHLEPSGRSEAATYGLGRINRDMEKRHKEKGWSK